MTEYIVNPEEEHNLFYGRKFDYYKYCPNCGTRLYGEGEQEKQNDSFD